MIVRNIKLSAKLDGVSCLNTVCDMLRNQHVKHKQYPSYVTFYNKYNYILFTKSKNNKNHINITRLTNVDQITDALDILQQLISCNIVQHSIDNITATHDMQMEINLDNLICNKIFPSYRYNPERFPGMFVKDKNGSLIIFHSGKLVLLGCKSIEQLWILLDNVVMKLNY